MMQPGLHPSLYHHSHIHMAEMGGGKERRWGGGRREGGEGGKEWKEPKKTMLGAHSPTSCFHHLFPWLSPTHHLRLS